MSMNDEIQAEVARYLARYNAGTPPAPDEDIFELGTITSLVAMQVVLFIERRWQIRLDTRMLKKDNFQRAILMMPTWSCFKVN